MRSYSKFYGILSAFAVAGAAQAQVVVSSYALDNGSTVPAGVVAPSGATAYLDSTYTPNTGTGNPTVASSNAVRQALAGGTGKLTDGVLPTTGFVDPSNATNAPRYVAWYAFNPVVTFMLAPGGAFTGYDLSRIEFFTSNTGFNQDALFDSVTVEISKNGTTWTNVGGLTKTQTDAVRNSGATGGFMDRANWIGANLTVPQTWDGGTTLVRASFTRFQNNANFGVYLGEVRFTGTAVPEPTTLAIVGLGALGMLRRRNKKA